MTEDKGKNGTSNSHYTKKGGKTKDGKKIRVTLRFQCARCSEKWRREEDAEKCCNPLWEKQEAISQGEFLGPLMITTLFVYVGPK